jgi:TPR repeat protein
MVVCGANAARDTQTTACRMAGFAYGIGRGVQRDVQRSVSYYAQACNLGNSPADCTSAFGGACILKIETNSRRTPDMDPYCNPRFGRPGLGPIKAYSPDNPSQYIEGDECFGTMSSNDCRGVNVASKQKSAYCCLGQ